MENIPGKRKPTISLSLFTTLSESFSFHEKSSNPTKSPRNFENGVVGLGIVAAMTELSDTHESFLSAKISPRSRPIPIVSLAKPAANFKGGFNLEREETDELSESYTCVISHCGHNLIKKRVYFGDKICEIDDRTACVVNTGIFCPSSPMNITELNRELCGADFLNSCYLCQKQLDGRDIFMYRGEKAFCSVECRDKQIRSDYRKAKCGNEARKPLDYSVSPCSEPHAILAGVAAA